MSKKKIIVSVTNDLSTDQRVDKICNTLVDLGFEVLLIGRKLKNSTPLNRRYSTSRMALLFNKGPLFYAMYNCSLFFKLIFIKKDILVANDLDTLLANYMVSKLFNIKLVYDSHELFTAVPELIARPKTQLIWKKIEAYIFPKLKNVYTVNDIIADIYSKKYGVVVNVVRNIAPKYNCEKIDSEFIAQTKGTNKMLILQGAGINIDRGGEEAVEMMQYLENIILYIIGSGDVFDILKEKIKTLNLTNKVVVLDKMPYNELMKYTQIADLGLSLDKNTNLNYEYSLPNKIFDYIQAQTPLLVSNRKIIAQIVNSHQIGQVINTHNPKKMAEAVSAIFNNQPQYANWIKNIKDAASIYNWENESKKLTAIYNNLK